MNYEAYAQHLARKYRLPFFPRQIRQESGFDPNARSGAGAIGIAQIMPGTARGWHVDPNDPKASLEAAARHMREYVDQYGSPRNALIAYNAGPGRVGSSNLPSETRAYIQSILGNHQGRSSAPDMSNVSSHTTMQGSVPGLTQATPEEPSVYDVIRRYREATTEQTPQTDPSSPLQNPYDPQKAGTQIEDTVKRIMAIRGQTAQALQTGDAEGAGLAGNMDAPASVAAMLKEADRVDAAQLPYKWGGGHAPGNVRGGKLMPLDCSGAVSRILGLDPRVASQFKGWGSAGHGKNVTVYANDEHVLMEINGQFFGTSRSNPGGGAGWIPRSAISKQYLSRFVARHPRGL